MKCKASNKKTTVKVGITEDKIFKILIDKYDVRVAEGEIVPFDVFCKEIAIESKVKSKASKNFLHKSVSKVTEKAIYRALNIYENQASDIRPSFYEWCKSRYVLREE